MRRVTIALLLMSTVWACAQAPFTIVRPKNGASVREKVEFRVPKNSVSENSYLILKIDDQFQYAIARQALGEDTEHLIWAWDTKKEKIADGPHKIELELWETAGATTQARLVDRTSVSVTISNMIQGVPATGIPLAYKWRPSQILDYHQNYMIKSITEARRTGTTIADETDLDIRTKIQGVVVDRRPEGFMFSWIPMLPIRLAIGDSVNYLNEDQLAATYWRVDGTGYNDIGFEVLGQEWYYATFVDLPRIPKRNYSVGDSWATGFIAVDPTNTQTSLADRIVLATTGTAKLTSFEWERGYKCARIEITPLMTPPNLSIGGTAFQRVKISRLVWFAYDIGAVIKQETRVEMERASREGVGAGAEGSGPAPRRFGGAPASLGGRGGAEAPGGESGGEEDRGFGGRGAGGGRFGSGQPGVPSAGGGLSGGGGFGGRGGGGAPTGAGGGAAGGGGNAVDAIVRTVYTETVELIRSK